MAPHIPHRRELVICLPKALVAFNPSKPASREPFAKANYLSGSTQELHTDIAVVSGSPALFWNWEGGAGNGAGLSCGWKKCGHRDRLLISEACVSRGGQPETASAEQGRETFTPSLAELPLAPGVIYRPDCCYCSPKNNFPSGGIYFIPFRAEPI